VNKVEEVEEGMIEQGTILGTKGNQINQTSLLIKRPRNKENLVQGDIQEVEDPLAGVEED
jgi:hypothetical protein